MEMRALKDVQGMVHAKLRRLLSTLLCQTMPSNPLAFASVIRVGWDLSVVALHVRRELRGLMPQLVMVLHTCQVLSAQVLELATTLTERVYVHCGRQVSKIS